MSYYGRPMGDYKTYGYAGDPGWLSSLWKGVKSFALPILGGMMGGPVGAALGSAAAGGGKPSPGTALTVPGTIGGALTMPGGMSLGLGYTPGAMVPGAGRLPPFTATGAGRFTCGRSWRSTHAFGLSLREGRVRAHRSQSAYERCQSPRIKTIYAARSGI